MSKERLKERVVFSGFYISQSGIKLGCKIEKMEYKYKEHDDEDCDYMVYFIDNAFSASLAKLALKSYYIMKGKLFFISEKEWTEFTENIVNTGKKWTISDAHGLVVELPGLWYDEATNHLGPEKVV
jgi:hypothetical protein